jgi:superfamily II DNA or RNA helicase
VNDQDLIAQIIGELHSLYRSGLSGEEQVGSLARARELFSELTGSNVSSAARPAALPAPGLVTTDDKIPLYKTLIAHLEMASSIRIASAFLSALDTNPIVRPLREAAEGGLPVRILTSVMGFFNRPDALRAFRDLGGSAELRLYLGPAGEPEDLLRSAGRGFHAKTILAEKQNGRNVLIVGSANLTTSGMRSNVEWSYVTDFEVNAKLQGENSPFADAGATFDDLWVNQSFRPSDDFLAHYAELYRRGAGLRSKLRALHKPSQAETIGPGELVPRPVQQHALSSLARLRAMGERRFAVVAATGIGKTVLSAFEVRNAQAVRILFIAHRETILLQAKRAYARVGIAGGQAVVKGQETINAGVFESAQVFAMVQTLAREDNLRRFPPEHFDYIVVDEFHHAAADSYRRIREHFKPKYLLGLTATPERMDGQDVLELCDRNVAYEVRLLDAVERGWLASFQYYALYDPTDYEGVKWTGRGYDQAQLEAILKNDTRADLIVSNLCRYQGAEGPRNALAFCSNVGHAKWMAQVFTERGLQAEALVGDTDPADRARLLKRLQDDDDELEILCAVDVLNEGVDVPSVTHIPLLRPTHSFTVFLQQLGRGLRLHPGKSFVVVLDFVGNFKKSFVAPLALQGYTAATDARSANAAVGNFLPPTGCVVDADTEVRKVWKSEIDRVLPGLSSPLFLVDEAIKEVAGVEEETEEEQAQKREVRLPDLFMFHSETSARDRGRAHGSPQSNIAADIRKIGGWLRVRTELQLADQYERALLGTPGEDLLKHVEADLSPNKSYKMAVLHCLLDMAEDESEPAWSVEEIAERFLSYYLQSQRKIEDWDELSRSDNPQTFPLSKAITHLKKMPLAKLSNQTEKPFELKDDTFRLKQEYAEYWQDQKFRTLLRERVEYAEARYWYGKGSVAM